MSKRPSISYRKTPAYRYELLERHAHQTTLGPERRIVAVGGWVSMDAGGELVIEAGYQWDGPSGPTFDTKSFMRGSLIHDALYQLIRQGLLPEDARHEADRILRWVCRADGMSRLRAAWVYWGVRRFGGPSAEPRKLKVLTAP